MQIRWSAAAIAAVCAGCEIKEDVDTGADTGDAELAECVDPVAFDYDDQGSWGDDCGGDSQSPIDISSKALAAGEAPVLTFQYSSTPREVVNNGHSIEFVVDGEGNTLLVDGEAFSLEQFHFHSPSEHTIDGQNAAMELHLVHKSEADASDLAVVGILIDVGDEQPWLAAAGWDSLPSEPGECELDDEGAELDMDDLISGQLIGSVPDVVHYSGSLTTPPCSEVVRWFILGQYLTVSQDQLDTFQDLYVGNNRDTQPLGGRELVYDSALSK